MEEREKCPSFWEEYESAARWCAARGLKAETGDPLPNLISADVEAEIQDNTDAFRERVRAYAYARAMESSPWNHHHRDISSITEYGMTCPLSRAVRVY